MSRKLLGWLIYGFLFPLACAAQVPFFQHHALLRRNEDVFVNTIFQDKAGFLWFGTKSGLFRFDGASRQQYTHKEGLPDECITAIAEDSAGRLWLGGCNGKLAYLENGTVRKFQAAEGDATSEISAILFDTNGNLWYSTLGDGIYYQVQGRLYRLDEDNNLPDLNVYDIVPGAKGTILAATDQGLAICSLKGSTVSVSVIDHRQGLPDNIIRRIRTGSDGTIWLATEDKGIVSYRPSSGTFKSLSGDRWTGGPVKDFLLSRDKIWIASRQEGLLLADTADGRLQFAGEELPDYLNGVEALGQDGEGNIWIGTSKGLLQTPGDVISYIDLPQDRDQDILTVAADKHGNTWYGTREGLFKRSTDLSGKAITIRPLANSPYAKFPVVSLYVDNAGYVWAGFYGEGAVRIHPESGALQYLKSELHNGNVLHISGKNNVVWLATLGGATCFTVNGSGLKADHFNKTNGLASDFIYQVFIDSRNRTWFATDGKGAVMMDDDGFHLFQKGFQSKVIYGFAEDALNRVWAFAQEGIYRFDSTRFVPDVSVVVPGSKHISVMTSDAAGRLVLMHDYGIDLFDVKSNHMISLGPEAGIRDRKPNLNAVSRMGDGIFFATDNGIVVMHHLDKLEYKPPLAYLEGLRVSNQVISMAGDLRFQHDENDITINYLGFWYQDPERLHYRFRLENFDKGWIESRNRSVTYSSLPPGDYTFRLEVSDRSGFTDPQSTSLHFVIRPPFWKTTGFYAASLLFGLVAIYGFVVLRERKLRADKRVLEEKNEELKKTNMELDRFVYSVSHDLRAPLSSMLGIIEISEEESKDDLQLQHLGMLKGSILKLDGFIKDILDYSRNARTDLSRDAIDFNATLSTITGHLLHAGPRLPDIQVAVEEKAPFHTDRRRLDIVLNNVISNAIRYQKPGSDQPQVEIRVETSSSGADIVIADNGIGIRKEDLGKIFDMFYRAAETSVGSGLGLYIVKETVARLQGTINVDSEPGRGTSFRICLPNI